MDATLPSGGPMYTLPVKDFETGIAWMRKTAPAFAAKLAPVYETLKWTWGDEKRIPNCDDILKSLLKLVDGLKFEEGQEGFSVRSGGLEVCIVRDGGMSFEARMGFFLSECLFESSDDPHWEA